jgi:hypothetical protein
MKISNPVEGHSEVLLNWEQEITRRMGLRPIPLDLEEIQLHCEICHKPIHNACFKCANWWAFLCFLFTDFKIDKSVQ